MFQKRFLIVVLLVAILKSELVNLGPWQIVGDAQSRYL